MKELPRVAQEASPTGVCLKTKVADSDEAAGQDVKQESLDEVRAWESERCAAVVAPAVAVAKRHLTVFVGHEPFVADGDAMCVAAEVAQHLLRAGHGGLAVDDPFLGGGLSEEATSEVRADASGLLPQ